MTRPRFTGSEWERLVARLERTDELALDDGTASRLLSGNLAPDDPLRDALDTLDTDAALRVLSLLVPDQAEVLLLRILAGLDVQRVAEIVGKRPGTVRVLQHRGLRRLAELLGPAPVDAVTNLVTRTTLDGDVESEPLSG